MKVTETYYNLKDRKEQQETLPRKERVKKEEIITPCTMFLDQASGTGFSIYDNESRIIMSGVLERGNKRLYSFKEELVDYILERVEEYEIGTIFYEEVYDAANMKTTETLFYLKHSIQDLGYAEEGLEVLGLSHKTWKKLLSGKSKFAFGKDDKKEVRKWVGEIYPLLAITVQDEFDAIGMGVAMMIQQKGQKNYYHWAKYNKKLPVHTVLYEKVFEDKENLTPDEEQDIVNKMTVAYRRGYAVEGLFELDLNRRKEVYDPIRRFLSHVDGLVYIKIPKDYKYWGLLMLLHGKEPKDFQKEEDDGGYYILASRKKRL